MIITTPDSTVSLTYEGPEEVLLKTPVVFMGHYDRTTIDHLILLAEDQSAFQVNLDPQQGSWEANLDEGFYTAGSRWLRLQGRSATGQVVGERLIALTVSAEPLSVGQSIQAHILHQTLFKVLPWDSASLSDRQMLLLKAGQILGIDRYGYTDGYVYVELTSPLGSLGRWGYIHEPHVSLVKGREILKPQGDDRAIVVPNTVNVRVLQDTWLKGSPTDSGELAPQRRCRLQRGQVFSATAYACHRGHFQLTLPPSPGGRSVPSPLPPTPISVPVLPKSPPPIPANTAQTLGQNLHRTLGETVYVPWSHVQVTRGDRDIPFDPHGLSLVVTQDSVFKKWAVNRSNLKEGEWCPLPQGSVYGLLGYSPMGQHVKVALTENLPGFGNGGYCLRHQIQVRRGGQMVDLEQTQVELNVPYVSHHHPTLWGEELAGSLGLAGMGMLGDPIAALAMVLAYHGITAQTCHHPLAWELQLWCQQRYPSGSLPAGGGSHWDSNVVVRLIQSYGLEASFSTHRTWPEVRQRISQGQPVVVESYCTPQGHGLCLIGFTATGYWVNDPWGNALGGYRDRLGAKCFYPHAYLDQMCRLGSGGQLGAYFITPRRSNLERL